MFICGTAKKYERQRFFHRFGQAISEKSSRMEYQFGDDFLLQDADPVGEKTRTASGRRAGSEIAANGPKTQRQTVQKRSGKRLGGTGLEIGEGRGREVLRGESEGMRRKRGKESRGEKQRQTM